MTETNWNRLNFGLAGLMVGFTIGVIFMGVNETNRKYDELKSAQEITLPDQSITLPYAGVSDGDSIVTYPIIIFDSMTYTLDSTGKIIDSNNIYN